MIRAVVSGAGGNKLDMLCGHFVQLYQRGEFTGYPFHFWLQSIKVQDIRRELLLAKMILAAFQKFGGHPIPLVALFTWDKEIGSPASEDAIMAEVKNARVAFNSEPGRSNGNIIIG